MSTNSWQLVVFRTNLCREEEFVNLMTSLVPYAVSFETKYQLYIFHPFTNIENEEIEK